MLYSVFHMQRPSLDVIRDLVSYTVMQTSFSYTHRSGNTRLSYTPPTSQLPVISVPLRLERFPPPLLPRSVDIASVLPEPLPELALLLLALSIHLAVVLIDFPHISQSLTIRFGVEIELSPRLDPAITQILIVVGFLTSLSPIKAETPPDRGCVGRWRRAPLTPPLHVALREGRCGRVDGLADRFTAGGRRCHLVVEEREGCVDGRRFCGGGERWWRGAFEEGFEGVDFF
jgi:hypothetical protein